jgi:hypothetical protein
MLLGFVNSPAQQQIHYHCPVCHTDLSYRRASVPLSPSLCHNCSISVSPPKSQSTSSNRATTVTPNSHEVFRKNELERKRSASSSSSSNSLVSSKYYPHVYSLTYDRPYSRLSLGNYSTSSSNYLHSLSPTRLTYTRPLSPMNYEFFKSRYKQQLHFLSEYEKSFRSN